MAKAQNLDWVSDSEALGESVQIKFLPLDYVRKNIDSLLFDRNSKRHDVGALYQSIQRYGFVDPPKWDENLNGGKGGIVYGNGRMEVFAHLYQDKIDGKKPPRGIPVSKGSGDWLIPVKCGVDCSSESEAMVLAIDHNNLVMSGGDFTARDMTKLWDTAEYIGLLKDLAEAEEMPITVDEEDLASLLLGLANEGKEEGGGGETEEIDVDGMELEHRCPKCGFEYDSKK